ncbi:MAG: helix-turn-helix domain-containing protein [Lachnospiraceae bacterium]|nr:helix-turn-helix domain-containing protein [Lachnospiraceae bacterium]
MSGRMRTEEIYQTLKDLSVMELSYMEYHRSPEDYLSLQMYTEYFQNRVLQEKKLYRFYFPSPLQNTRSTASLKDLTQLKSSTNIVPGYDFSICKQFNFPGNYLHNCDYYTFVCQMEGEGVLSLENTQVEMKPGGFFLIPADVNYALETQPGSICLCMNLRHSFIASHAQELFSEDLRMTRFIRETISHPTQNRYAALKSKPSEEHRRLLLEIFSEYLTRDDFSNIVMRCCLTLLFSFLLRDPETIMECPGEDDRGEKYLIQIIRYIRQNYQTVTLTDLARSIHLSKQYVCRIIRQQTGDTYSTLLNRTRMQIACDYLAESDLSVEEIAYMCGFSEPANFTRQFKKDIGKTPSIYRREKKSGRGEAFS